ncbi:rhodanese-like domain-containing protein [Chryseolinea sp. H1M3-3]|uniref:rhodanese-like domain-containing protein n=1 Tax=Chryseolinea sp. H1M3-3 TaxID=3034144 RepID=UPI0023EC5DB2|nr:rhodanese-like domain-containing protein [Chryseolinea sp. H1M3-3]
MFNLFSSPAKDYSSLSGREFKEKFLNTKKPVLIDVRTASEYSSGTIKGSKNIDIMSPRFKDAISKLDKTVEYFIFCRSGGRSAQACSIMAKEGFKVNNLKGGVGEWPQ